MSALAALYNVPSTTPELSVWGFAHTAHHRDIIRRIFELSGIRLEEQVLDPFDPTAEDAEDWAYSHQLMHNQMDAVLGISGYNLLDADFKDVGSRSSWIYLNADEHRQAATALGFG